ncbi:uncharacterized protein LOC128957643 [Oppia nitens]|uniref:uncharacterized protein LOC128957643 n=1 Tax=Oppia nitens TaxID=1686743 RepID=UPI0023DA3358|nr:uncharacterized protein LOC128957643 [Oppia nitens]
MNNIEMYLKIIVLSLSVFEGAYCATVFVSDDGPGVLDIPITFTAKLIGGDTPIDMQDYGYVFEAREVYPPHRQEVRGKHEVNYTIDYKSSETSEGLYTMKVQVFIYIWGIKGWLIAEDIHQFKLQNGLAGSINIQQSGLPDKALNQSLVATNRTVEMNAVINDGSHSLKNASISYTWIVDSHKFGPNNSSSNNVNFTESKDYDINVVIMCNITRGNTTLNKLGRFSRQIRARNSIKEVVVKGNTWLQDGAVLHLEVNCTGGDKPFWHCYQFSKNFRPNFTCDKELIYSNNDCFFPITHYFRENGTYYVDIGVYNDVTYINKSIKINVYEIIRETQLTFVIIPIVSSILAIIIIVVAIAYHLQQRASNNLTLEVADFDFQNNDNLMEKTFFERLRESIATAMRETFFYPCNPCTRAAIRDYDQIIDDDNVNTVTNCSPINTNTVAYGGFKY